MARQVGAIKLCETIQGVCFYTMDGKYYARLEGSLDRKRFMDDPAFEGSRKSAGLLAKASVLASQLYRQLPAERKSRHVYQRLTGRIKLMLRDGWDEETMMEMLEQESGQGHSNH